jgi:tetratricopeptide (TPR) repeat protein
VSRSEPRKQAPAGARRSSGRPPAPLSAGRAARVSPGAGAAPAWLWPAALAALFGLALLWRLAYLARLAGTPFAGSLDADAHIYWAWSEYILHHGSVPPSPFFLAPLYPYGLAAARALGMGKPDAVLVIQAVLAAVAVVLLAHPAKRLAGVAAGLVVGVVLALLQSSTFFAGLLLPESQLFFLESVLVCLVACTDWSRAGLGRFATYGLLVGTLAQGRATNAVLLALVVPLARASGVRRWRMALTAAAAFVVVSLPAALANERASGELIPFTYNFGFNAYVGYNPDADGSYVDVTRGSLPVPLAGTASTTGGALDGRAFLLASTERALSPAASSAEWARRASAFVRARPARALALAGRKLLLTWNERETPQIESMASFARAAGPLGLPWIGSFGCLAILGLSGTPWALRRGAAGQWLVGYVALLSLALVPFFVTERYRHHLVPALAPLAAIALAELVRTLRGRDRATQTRAALPLALAAVLVLVPLRTAPARAAAWTFDADRAMRLVERGAYAEAVQAFAGVEAQALPPSGAPLPAAAATDLAALELRYGIALEALGRDAEAIAHWERATALDPNDVESLGRLSLAYEGAGRAADAARARARLAAAPGGRARLLVQQGWSAAGRGDAAGAERVFAQAIEQAPDYAMAREGLIRLLIQRARYDDAWRALTAAEDAGLDPTAAAIYAAFLELRRGDVAAARLGLARLGASVAPSDPVLARLLEDTRRNVGSAAIVR